MLKSILLIASGGFLAFTAAMWGIVFWYILIQGSMTLIEPNLPILIAEFALAILLFCLGLVSMFSVYILKGR